MYNTQQILPVGHDNNLMFSCAHPKQLHLVILFAITSIPIPILLARCALSNPIVLADLPCSRDLADSRSRERNT
jgi:hypothetical protein